MNTHPRFPHPERYRKDHWSDERASKLRELRELGYSAADIAGILGGVTRNAVCGKAWRMNLEAAPRKLRIISPEAAKCRLERRQRADWRRANPPPPRPARRAKPMLPPDIEAPVSLQVPLLNLENGMCKYAAGEIRDGFCGHPSFAGSSWCAYHYRIVYQPHVDRSNAPLAASRLTGQIVEPMQTFGTSQALPA